MGNTIDDKVDLLVVERNQARNFCAVRDRHRLRPRDVFTPDLAYGQAPIARKSLVSAARAVVGGLKQVHANVGLRHVVANRRPRFVNNGRSASVGELHTVERNFDVAGAVQKIDALIWIVRVDENLLFFLEPGVHPIPFETHVPPKSRK